MANCGHWWELHLRKHRKGSHHRREGFGHDGGQGRRDGDEGRRTKRDRQD